MQTKINKHVLIAAMILFSCLVSKKVEYIPLVITSFALRKK
jgi:hypothetical protein